MNNKRGKSVEKKSENSHKITIMNNNSKQNMIMRVHRVMTYDYE